MPWAKTEAGRLEIQLRSAVNSRAQRNLLLLIDGKKSDAQLLASVAGTSEADFSMLCGLGLIMSPASAQQHDAPKNGQAPKAMEAEAMSSSDVSAEPTEGQPSDAKPRKPPSPYVAGLLGTHRPVAIHVDIPIDVKPPVPAFGHVSKMLTALIASELGLRGFTLTLAVERATGITALMEVAERVLHQIENRKGIAVADKARRSLFGS